MYVKTNKTIIKLFSSFIFLNEKIRGLNNNMKILSESNCTRPIFFPSVRIQ